jgi:hypothetical protein
MNVAQATQRLQGYDLVLSKIDWMLPQAPDVASSKARKVNGVHLNEGVYRFHIVCGTLSSGCRYMVELK